MINHVVDQNSRAGFKTNSAMAGKQESTLDGPIKRIDYEFPPVIDSPHFSANMKA